MATSPIQDRSERRSLRQQDDGDRKPWHHGQLGLPDGIGVETADAVQGHHILCGSAQGALQRCLSFSNGRQGSGKLLNPGE